MKHLRQSCRNDPCPGYFSAARPLISNSSCNVPYRYTLYVYLLVRSLTGFHHFISQLLFVQFPIAVFFILPGSHVHKFIIMTQGFTIFCLTFLPEMTTTTFIS